MKIPSSLLVVPLLLAPSLGAYAAGANDLDVTIRMIDRRNASVDRVMNRIQLPADLAQAAADRPDRRSQNGTTGTDDRQKDGAAADGDSSPSDRSDDGHSHSGHDRSSGGDDPRPSDNRPSDFPRQQLSEPFYDLKPDSRPDSRGRPGKK